MLTYSLSLALFGKRRVALDLGGGGTDARPSVAICMSAYNEASVIEAKIESLLAIQAEYGHASIHVYVDGASDGTGELASRYADRIDLVFSEQRRGKTFGLNLLVGRASSDLLLFTDANVQSRPDALTGLVAALADPQVGCASAKLEYTNSRDSPTSAIGAFYWSIEEALKRVESQTVGLIGVDGAMFLIRRALYRPAPPHLIDDLYVSLNVLIQRAHIVSAEHVVVTERSAVGSREEYRRKMRIACQAMNVHRALWPQLRHLPPLLLYAYVSHRLLKWLSPFLFLGAAIAFVGGLVALFGWRIGFGVPAGLTLLLFAAGALRIRPAAFVVSMIFSLAGVGLGVLKSWFTGATYTVWQPAASIRAVGEGHVKGPGL